MKVSLNEVGSIVTKATIGAGWPEGLAEDVGNAAVWLSVKGHDGVSAAASAIEPLPETLAAQAEELKGGWRFPNARAVSAGPSAFDLLSAGASAVALMTVDSPLLVLGFAGVAADDDGGYGLSEKAGTAVRVYASKIEGDVSVVSTWRDVVISALPMKPDDGSYVDLRKARPQADVVEPDGVTVDPVSWTRMLYLAKLTQVPERSDSRTSGAGAGAIDNE